MSRMVDVALFLPPSAAAIAKAPTDATALLMVSSLMGATAILRCDVDRVTEIATRWIEAIRDAEKISATRAALGAAIAAKCLGGE